VPLRLNRDDINSVCESAALAAQRGNPYNIQSACQNPGCENPSGLERLLGGRAPGFGRAKLRFIGTGEKMRYLKVGLAAAVLMLSLAPALPAQLNVTPEPGSVRTFQITAENYRFNPFNVLVNQGDKVRLVITAADRDYDFKLKAYDIKQKVEQGVPATIDFTASQAGTFTFDSPGMMHRSMKGTLVVRGVTQKKKKK
jgi:plastocyanin